MFESTYTSFDIVWSVRPSLFDSFNLVILFTSLLLLTIARLSQQNFISVIWSNTFNNFSFYTPISSGASIPLFVNYILIGFGFTLLLLKEYLPTTTIPSYYFLGGTLLIILIPFINFLTSTLFAGYKAIFNETLHISQKLIFLKSVLFSLLLTIWTFNNQWNHVFLAILIGLILLFFFLRVFLSVKKSFHHPIRWYYLILYFCTFEILPYAFILIVLGRYTGVKIV